MGVTLRWSYIPMNQVTIDRDWYSKSKEKEPRILIFKAHTLECQDHGMSHQAKNLGCMRPLNSSGFIFTTCN